MRPQATNIQKAQRIESLTGLKAVAMLLLFWHHSVLPLPEHVDIGARACEFMFLVSGFLVGYNNFYKEGTEPTWNDSVQYVKKKVLKFWPLHMIALLMVLCKQLLYKEVNLLSIKTIVALVADASLLQAWSPSSEIFFSFNGASWFLSALMFCYFMAPFLCTFMKNMRTACKMFVAILVIRCFVEYVEQNTGGILGLNQHVSPVVRCMEFFMGMLLVPLIMWLKEHLPQSTMTTLGVTLLELLGLASIVVLSFRKNETWGRSKFVLMFCVFLVIFALDAGIISKFFSLKPFRMFSSIQFEFYILHQAVIISFTDFYLNIFQTVGKVTAVTFVTIISFACLYKVAVRAVVRHIRTC